MWSLFKVALVTVTELHNEPKIPLYRVIIVVDGKQTNRY